LRLHPLVAHPGDIHAPGIERDVIAQRLIGRRRVAIGPRDCMNAAAVDDRVEVARGAFEFTPGRLRATVGQQVAAHVVGRHVHGRRVTGLEHAECTSRVGQRLTGQFQADAPSAYRHSRRAGIIPDTFHG
jgi:hypothetical protein